MANILAVGIATLDIINTTDGFPQEDDEVRASHQEIRRGGNATNTLVVLSQLGHQCQWLGCLADDMSAKIITSDLDHYKIKHSSCEIHHHSVTPTSYITLNNKNGSRTIVHYRDLPEMSAATFKRVNPDDFDWIHFEGRNVSETKAMLSDLNKSYRTFPVSIEIEKNRDELQDLFTDADIYFFSKAFAVLQGYSDAESFLRYYRKKIPSALLVCTWGSEGAYGLGEDQLHFSKAPKIPAIVDTVGAGDTFIAGFIHASLEKHNLQARLEYACEVAAKKCSITGFKNLI